MADAAEQVFGASISPEAFGAAGDGRANDTDAVLKALHFAVKEHKSLVLKGRYRMASQLVIDVATVSKIGFEVIGRGPYRTGFIFDNIVPSPNMLLTSTGPAFYEVLRGFSIQCDVAGICLQIGAEDYRDQHNETKLDLVVNNVRSSAEAVAIEINAVYNADAVLIANGGGISTAGTALMLRQIQFSRIFGSFGNAAKAIHIANGYTVGNVFEAMDIEEAQTGVTIDSRNAQDNHFIAGTLADLTYGYDSISGARNIVEGPSLGISPSKLFDHATGMIAHLNGTALMPTPPMPASGLGYSNNSGQPFMAYLIGGSVNSVTLNGATVAVSSPAIFEVFPGDIVVVTYSGGSVPRWTWRAL